MSLRARTGWSRAAGALGLLLLIALAACGSDPDGRSIDSTATPVATAIATLPPTVTLTRTPLHTPTGIPTGNGMATLIPTGTPAGTVSATITPIGTPAGTVSATVTPTCEPCGDGQLGPCEECDDGNTDDGDCCSIDCRFEPAGSDCDDGDLCTVEGQCDATGECVSESLCGNDVVDALCGEQCDGTDDPMCQGRCLFNCRCAPDPTCEADPSRILFAGGPGSSACRQFENNAILCEQAFHLGGGGVASCWYDSDSGRCEGCGPGGQSDGRCLNTCRPVRCVGDAARTVFVGGPGSDNCGRFNRDPVGCQSAYQLNEGGVASCWYETGSELCRGCDTESVADGLCSNTCAACEADPTRILFAGGSGTSACRQFDGDEASCAIAFHRDNCANAASCFYNSSNECRGCGPSNQAEGECRNSCAEGPPACDQDPSRTIFAGGPGTNACRQFDEDPVACQQAFHLNQCGRATACYFNFSARSCRGCGPTNLLGGECIDTCVSGPLPCTNDPERTVFAGVDPSSDCPNLGLAAGTAACEAGYQLGASGLESCFMDASTCRACDPGNEADGACGNSCVTGPPTCEADSTRMVYAGGPGTSACRQFDGDQTACEGAFHRGVCGVASCFYDPGSGDCRGCGPSTLRNGACVNTCEPPSCDADPARDLFVGGPGTSACASLNENPSACARAFHRGDDGIASCWYDAEDERCRGCGPGNREEGLCANTCLTCERDPSRTVLAIRSVGCGEFTEDREACEHAFQVGDECPSTVSCFFDPSSEECRACDTDVVGAGTCTNTCASGPPTCDKDPSRTLFAGFAGTSACKQFNGDPTSCLRAFHRGERGTASCWYEFEDATCRGCGPNSQVDGNCINTCLHGPPLCERDPSRGIFAGGPGTNACRTFDGNRATCENAFHFTDCLEPASCYYDPGRDECRGCGPNNESEGNCVNTCSEGMPACELDSSRVFFAGGPGTSACQDFEDDRTSCLAAFHLGKCGVASCYFNGSSCQGCGPSKELDGECFNTCQAP